MARTGRRNLPQVTAHVSPEIQDALRRLGRGSVGAGLAVTLQTLWDAGYFLVATPSEIGLRTALQETGTVATVKGAA
jgi:hypothetical protein